jgi:alpha-L-fucosidase 2
MTQLLWDHYRFSGDAGYLRDHAYPVMKGAAEPEHRHASHLMALYPLSLITPRGTPELFNAARRSLELRGSGANLPTKDGWWARLLDGDKALDALASPNGPTRYTNEYAGYPELLVQSHAGEVELLPALPTSWTSGKILGLRARAGYEVDIEWSNHKLTKATIRSSLVTTPVVRIQGKLADVKTDPRLTLVGCAIRD